eukprot:COSAG06_NODE_3470_length_5297_cov_18.285879_7_plen_156_part_01
MTWMHSSTSGALRRGPLGFTMRGCAGCLRGTVEFLLRSLLRVAFRLPLRRATRWRGRTGRSQCTSYNRFSSGRNGALTAPGSFSAILTLTFTADLSTSLRYYYFTLMLKYYLKYYTSTINPAVFCTTDRGNESGQKSEIDAASGRGLHHAPFRTTL